MSNAIVTGSVSSVAVSRNQSLALTWANVKIVALVDVSGSMGYGSAYRSDRRPIDIAREQLAKLQASNPGAVGVCSFASDFALQPGGSLPEPAGGTDLAGALQRVREYLFTGQRLVVVSDGAPNDEDAALREARQITVPIDVIFCGEEGQPGYEFLRRLALAHQGVAHKRAANLLADTLKQSLLLADGRVNGA